MKKIVIALCTVSSLLLISCGATNNNSISIAEYNKVVEERDYYKEQYEALTNSQQENSDIFEETEQLSDTDFNYFLDNLSASDIVNECMSILNNYPQKGTTLDQYESSFKYKPMETYADEMYMYFKFAKETSPEISFPDKNAITYVTEASIGTQMDGTIAMNSNSGMYPAIELDLCIKDYETAVAVYDGLLNELSPSYSEISDIREGTTWRVNAAFRFSSDIISYVDDFIRMKKLDNGFWIHVRKHYPWE